MVLNVTQTIYIRICTYFKRRLLDMDVSRGYNGKDRVYCSCSRGLSGIIFCRLVLNNSVKEGKRDGGYLHF